MIILLLSYFLIKTGLGSKILKNNILFACMLIFYMLLLIVDAEILMHLIKNMPLGGLNV